MQRESRIHRWAGVALGAVALAWAMLFVAPAFAAEVMPPKPKRHFNDYAGVVSVPVQQSLGRRLEDLEKTNSTQVLVAIFRRMESDSSIEDYTVRVAQSWGVGTKEKDNGAVLFVFVEDRKMYLQVGYGLEGAVPDITAKDITENRIKPHFRNNNYDAGLTAGVDAIIQAVRGEYKGTGRTVAGGRQRGGSGNIGGFIMMAMIVLFILAGSTRRRRGWVYGGRGRSGWGGPIIWTGGGGGRGGWGGGGGGGGWGGGFSGGGGSFGGGGAGSSW